MDTTSEQAENFLHFHIFCKMIELYHELDQDRRGEKFILLYLYMKNPTAFPKELTSFLQTSTAHTAAMLLHLEQKNLIERHRDTVDNRKIHVTLTAAGKQKATEIHDRLSAEIQGLLAYLGKEDTEQLLRIQNKILNYSHKQVL